MFVCKICGNEVKVGQAFCSKCGADVVENYQTICSSCGTKNGAGSRFCAKCGGILPILRKPLCTVCGTLNLPGARFCVACGAPIIPQEDTHTDAEVLESRKAKMKIDMMEKERMQAIDKEIAQRRSRFNQEKELALQEIETERRKNQQEIDKQAELLNRYHERLNELGSEDVLQLKKVAEALRQYSIYYADPYSEIDEDEIIDETYVCPCCGTINPLNVVACSHCGRNKARATLLLAKDKIVQRPPIKRKKAIIPPPVTDTELERLPESQNYTGENKQTQKIEKPVEPPTAKENVEKPADFSGPAQMPFFGGYPFGYPYPAYDVGEDKRFQMPPIVQPVAFVPYVTQDQPVMQYAPAKEEKDER